MTHPLAVLSHSEGLDHLIAPTYDDLLCASHFSVILKTTLNSRHNCLHFTDAELGVQVK